jgi:hydrogenase-4 component F
MVVLLIVIFIGVLNHFRAMYFDGEEEAAQPPLRVSRWCVAPMWLALAPLLVFGLWWPNELWNHFMAAAQTLTGVAP